MKPAVGKPRLLMVGPSTSALGGISSVVQTLLDSDLSERYDLCYVATTSGERGVLARVGDALRVARACIEVGRGRPIVHVHMSSGGSFYRKATVLWWSVLLRRPTVIHLHGGRFHAFAAQSRFQKWVVARTFAVADHVLVLSPEWHERIATLTGRHDSVIVPNPVVIPEVTSRGGSAIVFLGRLGAQKGVPELLESIRALQARGHRPSVVLAGDGAVEETRQAVLRLLYPQDVRVPGWIQREEVHDLLCRSGVFCLPSRDEGKPVSLLEAMAHGLACIATPVGGVPDVIEDGVNGLLVGVGDSAALTEALERLLTDSAERARLGSAARDLVARFYAVDVLVKKLDEMYLSILDAGGQRPKAGSIHTLREAYEAIPAPVRTVVGRVAAAMPARLRYGSAFGGMLQEIRSVEWESREEQDRHTEGRLALLVSQAMTSRFWQEVFVASGLPEGPRCIDDLSKLPLLDKEQVRANVESMVVEGARPALRKWVTTGGTAGAPLGLWIDKQASLLDWAFVVNAWSRVGFELDEKRVVLRGRRLGSGERRKLTEYEPIRRELYLSTFDLDGEHLPKIRRTISKFGARFIHGYPSAMEVVGRSFRQAGEKPPSPKALLAVSENLYPGQREVLEDLFDSRVFSFYGMSEKGALAAECECSNELHVEPLYGIVELVDERGNVITQPGVRGEIVVTGLLSHSMPLIRYRTQDFAAWAEGPCACGRQHRRLCSVEGRWTQEFLVASSGARISMTSLNVHSPVFNNVRRFQFRQSEPGIAELLVEAAESYTDEDGIRIVAELDSKLRGQVKLQLVQVERIPQTAIGKQRFIDQRVGLES